MTWLNEGHSRRGNASCVAFQLLRTGISAPVNLCCVCSGRSHAQRAPIIGTQEALQAQKREKRPTQRKGKSGRHVLFKQTHQSGTQRACKVPRITACEHAEARERQSRKHHQGVMNFKGHRIVTDRVCGLRLSAVCVCYTHAHCIVTDRRHTHA